MSDVLSHVPEQSNKQGEKKEQKAKKRTCMNDCSYKNKLVMGMD